MKKSLNPLIQTVKAPLKALLKQSVNLEVNPTGDLQGFLESPNAIERNVSGVLRIAGWVFHRRHNIESLILIQDEMTEETITYGEPRPDVGQAFMDFPTAENSGFGWNLPIEPNFSGEIAIKIRAKLSNGESVCCFARTITIQNVYERPPKVKVSQMISGFMTKLILAYKQRGGIPLSPLVWIRFVKRYLDQTQNQPFSAYSTMIHPWQQQDPYQRWLEHNRLTAKVRKLMAESAQRLEKTGVKISVVVPVYNPPKGFLEETIASVQAQIYPNWELCIADDASTQPHVKQVLTAAQASDSRIKVVFRTENGHIVKATNSALEVATGDYIALLDHDDLLSPDALLHVAECVDQYPDVDWMYTDEDKITPTGERYGYQMKGVWSPEMAIAHNYTHHLAVIRKRLIDEVGGLRPGLEGAQDIDLYLRVREKTTMDRVRHIPHVCYHWRVHPESTASKGTQKTYVFDSAYRAISDTLERRNLKAKPFLPELATKYGLCLHQLQWDSSILAENPVTIVIPTRDRTEILSECIASLEKTVDPRYVQVIIVDDQSTEPKTEEFFQYLENPVGAKNFSPLHSSNSPLPDELKLTYQVIRTQRPDPSVTGREGFNYSRLVNIGAARVKTPLMLQLNNDITAIAPGWLEDMVGWMSIEGVGVVGARLLYPDHTLQHAGVCIGPNGGLAGHLFHGLRKEELGYLFYPHTTRNVSAVTGACLLTSTELYHQVKGFDEEKLGLELNDVDYCLRVQETGKRVVYTPQATLIHQGSASRGDYYNPKEHLNFMDRYQGHKDPYINPNINIDSMAMDLNPLHYVHSRRISGIKILLVTHNLALEGAPLMVYNFAKHFVESGECQVKVVSLVDGPLRNDYEALNIPVKLIEDNLQRVDNSLETYHQRLRKVGEVLDMTEFDLVMSNTMVGFWGIELAQLFGLPSIWHIHESCTIERSLRNFFGDSPPQVMRGLLERCFQNASRAIFVADATRAIFHDLDIYGRFRTIPGGMDLGKIAEFRQSNSKSYLRQKYGIAEEKTVISVIGTTCERKGQHIFLEAIKQLEKIYPASKFKNLEFLIVGTREIIYLDYLRQVQERLKLDYVKMYPETRYVFDFFGLTDIFVCTSFEESFPRVVLEAMAFELKIVSTNVFGIPEMIGDRHEGYLVRPGDPEALANVLVEAIETDYANRLRGNAYARVNRLFDNQKQLPKHLEMVKEVVLQHE